MVAYKIDRQKTALVVIDMMNDFVSPMSTPENPEIREKLIAHCRAKGIPEGPRCLGFIAHGHAGVHIVPRGKQAKKQLRFRSHDCPESAVANTEFKHSAGYDANILLFRDSVSA